MSLQRTSQRFCRCAYPRVDHTGECLECDLIHKGVHGALQRAVDIPSQFYKRRHLPIDGVVPYLEVEIEDICWRMLDELNGNFTSENFLNCFVDTVYEKVQQLLDNYQLELTSMDEAAFKCL